MKINGPKSFVIGHAVSAYRLVKLLAGTVVHNTALATDEPIGVTLGYGAVGEDVSVEFLGKDGTLEIEAGGAIAKDADVYQAAAGRIVALGSAVANAKKIGKALQAASGSGSIIEVLPDPGLVKNIMLAGIAGVVENGLVQLSAGTIIANTATSTDDPIGVAKAAAIATAYAPVELLETGKPVDMIAAGAITLNADVYAAADGEVQAVPSVNGTYRKIGIALEAAEEDQDVISVLPYDYQGTITISG